MARLTVIQQNNFIRNQDTAIQTANSYINGNSSSYTSTLNPNYVTTGTETVGTSWWDAANYTTSTALLNGTVLQNGTEFFFLGQNNTGVDIPNGTVVRYSSSIGNSGNIRVEPDLATLEGNPLHNIGVATDDITNGTVGYITIMGKVRGIQTNGANYGETWANGDTLFVSTTIPGGLTNVKPKPPYPDIIVGIVISTNVSNGTIRVNPVYPKSLKTLSDVNDSLLSTTGQFPVWDSTNQYFSFPKAANFYTIKDTTNSLRVDINNNHDTLVQHRIEINNLHDTVAIHLDTIQSHNDRILANLDSIRTHTDTLRIHRIGINNNLDSILVHRIAININTNKNNVQDDTLASHNTRILANESAIATKQDQLNGTGFVKASGTTISYDNISLQPIISGTNIDTYSLGYFWTTQNNQYATAGTYPMGGFQVTNLGQGTMQLGHGNTSDRVWYRTFVLGSPQTWYEIPIIENLSSINIDTYDNSYIWTTVASAGTYPTSFFNVTNLGTGTTHPLQLGISYSTGTDLYYRTKNSSFYPWYKIWSNANSNLTTVDWSAQNLTLAGTITGATTINASGIITALGGNSTDWNNTYDSIPVLRTDVNNKLGNIVTTGSSVQEFTIDGFPARLYLPSSYNYKGTKTPLCIFFHFYGGQVYNIPPNGLGDSLLAHGYAIATLGDGNLWGNATSQTAYINLYDYVEHNYNLTRGVLGTAFSMGGLPMWNLVDRMDIPFNKIVAMDALVSLKGYFESGAYTNAPQQSIASAYNLVDSADFYQKTYGYSPLEKTNVIYGDSVLNVRVPSYFFNGTADVSAKYSRVKSYYNSITRTNRNTVLDTVIGGTHDTLILTPYHISKIIGWVENDSAYYKNTNYKDPVLVAKNGISSYDYKGGDSVNFVGFYNNLGTRKGFVGYGVPTIIDTNSMVMVNQIGSSGLASDTLKGIYFGIIGNVGALQKFIPTVQIKRGYLLIKPSGINYTSDSSKFPITIKDTNSISIKADSAVAASKILVNGFYPSEFVSPSPQIIAGSSSNNLVNKTGAICIFPYNIVQPPLSLISGVAYNSFNYVYIGGGSSFGSAATSIKFYTASSVGTSGGTERMSIDGNGDVLFGYTSSQGSYKSQVNGNAYVNGTGTFTGTVTAPTVNLTTGATVGDIWQCTNATTGAGNWAPQQTIATANYLGLAKTSTWSRFGGFTINDTIIYQGYFNIQTAAKQIEFGSFPPSGTAEVGDYEIQFSATVKDNAGDTNLGAAIFSGYTGDTIAMQHLDVTANTPHPVNMVGTLHMTTAGDAIYVAFLSTSGSTNYLTVSNPRLIIRRFR